jgi:hypothetical protein
MSGVTRTAGIFPATIALLAALGGCGRQEPVEAKLIGSWQTAIASPSGPYQLRFTTAPNGAYRIDSQGLSAGQPESGAFTAAGGKWRREKLTGGSDEGTYEFLSADTVLFKSKTDTMLWNRIPNDGGASSTTAVTQPSTDLLSSGPFGAPLAPSAAVPAPHSPAAADQFGAAVPPTVQAAPSTGGANGAAQAQSTLSSAGAGSGQGTNLKRSVQQSAAQGAVSAQHAAQQAAAQTGAAASDAVNDAATQTNKKVGQRIEAFAGNAGSKIRNFFTGHKQQNGDNQAGSSPAQQDGH